MANSTKIEKKYPGIVKKLRSRINSGLLTGTLPGVQQLAKEFDVNFMTVNKAIIKLEEEGLVYRIPRKGTYVKRMRSIAFCFSPDYSVYSQIYLGAQRYLSKMNCPMFLESEMSIGSQAMSALTKRIDGLIFYHNSDDITQLKKLNKIPAVRILGALDENYDYDHVTYDNNKIGLIAAQYFVDKGHKNVAYIGDQYRPLFIKRLESFSNAIENKGGQVHISPYDIESWEPRLFNIRKQVHEIMSRKERPTAIFCPSDNEIGMIYDSLSKLDIEPMKDVLILSCNNDINLLSNCYPLPVSIDICTNKIGALAAQRILERIENPELPKRIDLLEPTIRENDNSIFTNTIK